MRSRLVAIRRSLPDAFWLVWVGTLINRAGGFVLPLLAYYLTGARGLSQGQAAMISIGVHGAGLVAAGLVGGVLADRLGRRLTMAGSLLAGAAMMLVLSEARGLLEITLAAVGLGLVGELYRPAVMAFVADVVPAADRPRAFGLIYWAINLGFAISAVAGGLLADWSYRALFIGDAATMAIYGVIVLARVDESRPAAATDPETAGTLGAVLRDRVFMIFVGLGFATALIFYQSTVTLAAYLGGQGRSATAYGVVVGLNGVVIILLQPWLTARLAGADGSRVLAVAAATAGLGFGLHGLGAALPLHLVAVVVWTIAEILQSPFYSSVVATLAPPATRGRYQGVLGMTFGLGAMAGPPAGALAVHLLGASGPWLACAIVGVAAAAGYLVTAPGRRARGA